jgi:beta-N-acetylhexosaminidase
MYAESDPFVEVAARLLFQEISPAGSLPVSVPGIGYDLISATAPDPKQVISLSLDFPKATPTPGKNLTAEPTAEPLYRVGDTISVRTGVILDHNQHPVPDGTPVRFTLSQGESGLIQQVESETKSGIAVAAFRLDQSGLNEIRATSEPARVSDTIQLPNVTKEGATVIIITPTAEVTSQPPAEPTPTPEPTPVQTSPLVTTTGYPNLFGWFMVILVMAAGVSLTYWLASQMVDPQWTVRWSLLVLTGGLLTYNYLILGFPGGGLWLEGRGLPAFLQAVLIGQGVGFAVGWFWRLAAESGDQAQEQQNGRNSE